MFFKLTAFYFRESRSTRLVAYLAVMLLLTGFIIWGLPSLQGGPARVFMPVSLSIVDDDRSMISQLLTDQLSDIGLVASVRLESLPQALERLQANDVLFVLVIPPGFFDQSMAGQVKSPLVIHVNDRMPAETAVFVRYINQMADSVTAVQSAFFAFRDAARPLYDDSKTYSQMLDAVFLQLFFKMLARQSIVALKEAAGFNTIWHVLSAMICLLTLLSTLLVYMQARTDRISGLQDRMTAAHITWLPLAGARLAAGMIWLAGGFLPLLASLAHFYPHMRLAPLIAAIIILYTSVSVVLQAWQGKGSDSDMRLITIWMVLLLILLLGGCIYPHVLLPGLLRRLSGLSPARWTYLAAYAALDGETAPLPVWLASFGLLCLSGLAAWLGHRQPYAGIWRRRL